MSQRQLLLIYYILLWFVVQLNQCILEKIKYISLERPVVSYFNKKYVPYLNVTARRYNRADPNYYVSGYGISLLPLDDNITVNIHFCEFSSHTYKRTFFELHLKLCDLLNRDKFLGTLMKRGNMNNCPLPAGTYNVVNSTLSMENVPKIFPFKKGRFLMNSTYRTGEVLSKGYIDLEVKEKLV